MDAMEAILSRRSVRRFTTEPVSRTDEEALLHAAMNAPSSGNARPWHFVVITQRATLDRLADEHPSAAVLLSAPLVVLVCADVQAEKNPGRWMLDCSAAMENILLAAHALGLGAVWLAVWPSDQRIAGVCSVIDLPAGVHPLAMAAVGHPAEFPPPIERYHPARVHREQW